MFGLEFLRGASLSIYFCSVISFVVSPNGVISDLALVVSIVGLVVAVLTTLGSIILPLAKIWAKDREAEREFLRFSTNRPQQGPFNKSED